MKRITFHEEAEAEVIEAACYYEERSLGLGHSFLTKVKDAVNDIQANPDACQLVGDEVRRNLVQRFPYSVLYAIEKDRIRVMAVAHHKRRPEYWRYRLE